MVAFKSVEIVVVTSIGSHASLIANWAEVDPLSPIKKVHTLLVGTTSITAMAHLIKDIANALGDGKFVIIAENPLGNVISGETIDPHDIVEGIPFTTLARLTGIREEILESRILIAGECPGEFSPGSYDWSVYQAIKDWLNSKLVPAA